MRCRGGASGVVPLAVLLALLPAGCAGSSGSGGGGGAASAQGSTSSSTPPGSYASDPDRPVIGVVSPARGAFLDRQSHPAGEVLVEGSAFDATSGIARLTVNGRQATLDAAGGFREVVALEPGANGIVVVAEDLAGNEAYDVRSVLFAERYEPPGNPVERALCVRIGEAGFDALGAAVAGQVHHQGVLQQALLAAGSPIWRDRASLPLIGTILSIRVDLLAAGWDPPHVAFDARTGELVGTAILHNVAISGAADDDGVGLPWPRVTGDVTATRVELTYGLGAAIDPATGLVDLDVTRCSVVLSGFQVDFTNLPGQLVGVLPLSLRQPIEDALRDALTASLPPLLEQEINALFQPVQGAWMGRTVTLRFAPSLVDFDGDGCTFVAEASFTASSTVPAKLAPGAFFEPAHGQALPALPSVSPNLSAALLSNAWNRALFASWEAGFWDLTIDQAFVQAFAPSLQLPIAFNTSVINAYAGGILPPNAPMAVRVELGAQPVLRPTPAGPGAMRIALPEVHLELLVDDGSGMQPVLGFAVHVDAGLDPVVIGGSQLGFDLGGQVDFHAQLVYSGVPQAGGFDLERLLNMMVPSALAVVGRTIGPFPIGPLNPTTFVVLSNPTVTVGGPAGGYVILSGDL